MGPRPHLLFWAHITACLAHEYKDYSGSSPHCGFCIQNSDFWIRITSFYGSLKWPVILCMYNSVLSIRITTSLWVPAFICGFCTLNRAFWTRITSLYGSQTSPFVLCMQNRVICTRMTSLYGFQTSFVVLSTYNSALSTRLKRQYCLQPSPVVLCMQNSDFRTRLCGSNTPSVVFACKRATSRPE